MRALSLVQALGRMTWRDAPRLWLATRDIQPVAGEPAMAPAEACLWGLGRVIALEYPEWRCTLVDVARRGLEEEAAALADEVLADQNEEEIALRSGGRLVNRLITQPPPAQLDQQVRVFAPAAVAGAADATYVIAGGLEGFGLVLARWLVRRGARHLVLVGRGGVEQPARPIQWHS